MDGKASKLSKGSKGPTSATGSTNPGSSKSGDEPTREGDLPGGGLTMEAIGGRLLELEALVRRSQGQDQRKERLGEDYGEQMGIL